jgi:hypothetical protein
MSREAYVQHAVSTNHELARVASSSAQSVQAEMIARRKVEADQIATAKRLGVVPEHYRGGMDEISVQSTGESADRYMSTYGSESARAILDGVRRALVESRQFDRESTPGAHPQTAAEREGYRTIAAHNDTWTRNAPPGGMS